MNSNIKFMMLVDLSFKLRDEDFLNKNYLNYICIFVSNLALLLKILFFDSL